MDAPKDMDKCSIVYKKLCPKVLSVRKKEKKENKLVFPSNTRTKFVLASFSFTAKMVAKEKSQ